MTVLTVAVALVVALVAFVLLDAPAVSTLVSETLVADRSFNPLYALLSIAVIAPAEEVLFRGTIQGRLRRSVSAHWTILGASVLFAVPTKQTSRAVTRGVG